MGCGASAQQALHPDMQEVVDPEEDDIDLELQITRTDKSGKVVNKYDIKHNKPENDASFLHLIEEGSNEKSKVKKPWIGALKSPSNTPTNQPDAPSQQLELEYVNGYRCEDTRANLYYSLNDREIIFFTAAIGIIQNIDTNKQSFLGAGNVEHSQGHNDEIQCMDVCPLRKHAVTGQRGPSPLVLVWDVEKQEVKARLQLGRGNRAAKCVKFSKDCKQVYITDEHNDHHIHVFTWESEKRLDVKKTGHQPILDMDTSKGPYNAVIAGKKGLQFIILKNGVLEIQQGLFGSTQMVDMLSVSFTADGNKCVSGALTGEIYVWSGKQAIKSLNLHQGAVQLSKIIGGILFTSGTNDKLLKVLNLETLETKEEYKLSHYARAIDFKDNKIMVGTRGGSIIEISGGNQKVLMNSHSTGETWGLNVDYTTGLVITSGDDNKVIVFDPKLNSTIATTVVNSLPGKRKKGGASTLSLFTSNKCARAVAINPQNGEVAIANNEGDISIRVGVKELDKKVYEENISNEWIEVLRYSPDGSKLAVGSHDNHIYILDAKNGYSRISDCKNHSSFITSIDWSRDGQFFQSSCGAYEYLFYNASTGQQVSGGASQFRDEKWNTFTCKLGWPVQGVFPPSTDGSHVNGVYRSNNEQLFAVGDDWGYVSIFRNPCLNGNKCQSYRAHSSHVPRVQFDKNDTYLYSVGGYDCALMKWKLIQ